MPVVDSDVETKGSEISLKGVSDLLVGLSWDRIPDSLDDVDLDLSVCLFDQEGQFMESIYFNSLTSQDGSVNHTGDNRTGEGEGDDEEVIVNLNRVSMNVGALMIVVNSYSGHRLVDAKSASVRISNLADHKARSPKNDLVRYSLSTLPEHTALIVGKLYRAPSTREWVWQSISNGCGGRSFGDLLPQMQECLRDLFPRIRINPTPNVIVLAKGETVPLIKTSGFQKGALLSRTYMGLGWDMMGGKPIDLDASCLLFDSKRNLIEPVFFNRLTNSNRSVMHNGDNLTGEGEGDDEKIFVDLEQLPANVVALFFVVNSYSGESFAMIKNAYVRMVNNESKSNQQELIRFQLNGAGNPDHTALIMCKIYCEDPSKPPSHRRWMMKALGHGCKGRMYSDNVKDCQKEMAGRLEVDVHSPYSRYVPLAPPTKPGTTQLINGVDNTATIFGLIVIVLLCIILFQNLSS